MNTKLSQIICCPSCKCELKIDTTDLLCSGCGYRYKITNDIPVMIDLTTLSVHLQSQVNYFEIEDAIQNETHELSSWQEGYVKRFCENFPQIENKVILDCGTGSGYMAIELAKKGATVIACDLTMKSLVRLQKLVKKLNLEDKILLICCSAEYLPFKESVFDYFISTAVLEHLPKETEAISEINRTCKSNAGILITVPLAFNYIHPLLYPLNLYHDKKIGHLRRYDEDILKNKFEKWNLKKKYYTGHFKKVIKIVLNRILKIFDDNEIEHDDQKLEDISLHASNICVAMER